MRKSRPFGSIIQSHTGIASFIKVTAFRYDDIKEDLWAPRQSHEHILLKGSANRCQKCTVWSSSTHSCSCLGLGRCCIILQIDVIETLSIWNQADLALSLALRKTVTLLKCINFWELRFSHFYSVGKFFIGLNS